MTIRSASTALARSTPLVLPFVWAAAAAAQPQPTVGPQERIDPGGGTFAANETTAAASPLNSLEAVAGWNDWRRSPTVSNEVINCGFSLTLDGGVTWNDFLIRPPAANQTGVEGDPMTAWDPRTGDLWAGGIAFGGGGGMYVARKPAGAADFLPSVMTFTDGFTDKGWMAVGPRPGVPASSRVYISFNAGTQWSDDLGATWTDPTNAAGGIGYLPRVGPGGELYVSYWDIGAGIRLQRSFDGGDSFDDVLIATRLDVWGVQEQNRAPGTFRHPAIPALAVDPNTGDLYCVYFDTTQIIGGQRDLDLYFTRSTDQGATWTDPEIIMDDDAGQFGDPPADQMMPWVEVDRFGRLHVTFLDTREDPRTDGSVDGRFDMMYGFSVNAGDSWTRYRLSPNTFSSDDDGLNRANQFLGDYFGIAMGRDVAFPAYLDTSNGDTDIFTNRISLPNPFDVDGDGSIGFGDIVGVLAGWGPCVDAPCAGDVNGDGTIGLADLIAVLAAF